MRRLTKGRRLSKAAKSCVGEWSGRICAPPRKVQIHTSPQPATDNFVMMQRIKHLGDQDEAEREGVHAEGDGQKWDDKREHDEFCDGEIL